MINYLVWPLIASRQGVQRTNETENAKNFKIHILLKHSTEEKRKEELPYYCDICKFGTTIKSQYDKHILSNKHKKYTNIINEKAQE